MIQSNADHSNDDSYENHKEHFAQMSMEEIRKELRVYLVKAVDLAEAEEMERVNWQREGF